MGKPFCPFLHLLPCPARSATSSHRHLKGGSPHPHCMGKGCCSYHCHMQQSMMQCEDMLFNHVTNNLESRPYGDSARCPKMSRHPKSSKTHQMFTNIPRRFKVNIQPLPCHVQLCSVAEPRTFWLRHTPSPPPSPAGRRATRCAPRRTRRVASKDQWCRVVTC